MSAIMHDPSMWVQSAAVEDITNPPSARPGRRRTGAGNKRRADDSAEPGVCGHCGRSVSLLIFNNACTYECALALALPYYCRYDCVYTKIMSQLQRVDVSMPKPAPRLPYDTITAEEYWRRAVDELYSEQPIMREFLRERLQENAARVIMGDKKQRDR